MTDTPNITRHDVEQTIRVLSYLHETEEFILSDTVRETFATAAANIDWLSRQSDFRSAVPAYNPDSVKLPAACPTCGALYGEMDHAPEPCGDDTDSVKLRYEAQDGDHGDEFLSALVADGVISDADYRSGSYHPRNGRLTVTEEQARRILVPFAFGSKVAVWRDNDEPATDSVKPMGLSDIDWSGPADEIRSTLVDIWFQRHHWLERDSETLGEAEAWADDAFAENAQPPTPATRLGLVEDADAAAKWVKP